MNLPAHVEMVRRILVADGAPPGSSVGEIPAERYTSEARFAAERRSMLARVPSPVAIESELAEPGSCLTVDFAGVSLLVVRGDDGRVRAFRNACRHRSTRLLTADAPCRKKAFVCPYHGWSYDLRGQLLHVPHERSFRGAVDSRRTLVEAHAEVRHGLVWVALAPFDLAALLAPIDADLAALDVAGCMLYRRSSREVRGNWKLIVEAFLDGYHIRHLHRDSIYRFFLDTKFAVERAGDHIRALSARRTLLDVRDASWETAALRDVATPSYLVFPNTVLILHPDYVSILRAEPLAAGRTQFVHSMLIPDAPRTEASDAHWAKSFALIDEGVFLREDLAAVEAMQSGIESGANPTLLFGDMEYASLWFHESIERAIGT